MADTAASSMTVVPAPEDVSDVEVHKNIYIEAQKHKQQPATHWQLVFDQTHVTPEVLHHRYPGSGTHDDPYVVEYIPNDRRNPMLFPMWKK
jgi:hypothetical protein